MLLRQLKYNKTRHKDDREFQVWQEGSHPQQIQNADIMRQKLEYAHNNPVERGFVARPEHWLYSSAANYAGLPGISPVEPDWFEDWMKVLVPTLSVGTPVFDALRPIDVANL